ncbi:MAG: hypothetical protein OQJ99_00380 [Rhodospirillales bacterium]|nr:hypothetical protein [Rhodospirillales bacterium]MCW8861436.1 hypothetical protein [Rhodospirillales bacterium]MCW8951698.1 hypothetical protein [Rhodospirillales bacterium]MCW8970973.1 hypothetical protein [Rhodospirillales bacterium]MCW9003309.1 hypothetical protein [Rhodospirillales bacterium]
MRKSGTSSTRKNDRLAMIFQNLALALLFAAFAGPAIADGGDVAYATKTIAIYTDSGKQAKAVGKVLVAAKLTIMETIPGWSRVEIRGWHQEGAERVLYALPGKRIMSAVLSSPAVERLRPLDVVTDPDTQIIWKGAAFEGWIMDGNITSELGDIWRAAWDLFATRCTVCHQRRIPHKYTANQWVSLLKVMGPRTGLPKDDQRLILTYLQNHAKDTIKSVPVEKP